MFLLLNQDIAFECTESQSTGDVHDPIQGNGSAGASVLPGTPVHLSALQAKRRGYLALGTRIHYLIDKALRKTKAFVD